MKHRKDPNCFVCYPERAKVQAVIRYRQTGGYSPGFRCAAHQLKPPAQPPAGKGATS